jgi:amino acid permease
MFCPHFLSWEVLNNIQFFNGQLYKLTGTTRTALSLVVFPVALTSFSGGPNKAINEMKKKKSHIYARSRIRLLLRELATGCYIYSVQFLNYLSVDLNSQWPFADSTNAKISSNKMNKAQGQN